MPSKISSPPLSEFPLVLEELEITQAIMVQRRLSTCQSRGALTVKLREVIVWFGFLNSPDLKLAECFGEITFEIASLRLPRTEVREELAEVDSTHQSIAYEAQLENRSLTTVRRVLTELNSKEVLSHARFVIERSRSTLKRHHELAEAADRQISLCEQRIVLSRLKFLLDSQGTKRLCRRVFDPTVQDLKLILDNRELVREEQRIILDTKAEISRSGEFLNNFSEPQELSS
ncbi:MAG: hypothetical protein ACI9UA_005795 [Pseudoalteromonas tetraodonis]